MKKTPTPSTPNPFAYASQAMPRHTSLNIVDSKTTQGLSVHLQSPALKRRYWQQEHQETRRILEPLHQHQDWIRTALHTHGCFHLLNHLERDLLHFQQLEGLYARLYEAESQHSSSWENTLWRWGVSFEKKKQEWRHLLKAQVYRWLGLQKNGSNPEGQQALQAWIKSITHKKVGTPLSADIVQDVYRLKIYFRNL
jgi:hypothetical protein